MTIELDNRTWLAAAKAHRENVQGWTEPFRERRRLGKSHPVHDFLFVYYQYSPAKLEAWHPGVDVRIRRKKSDAPNLFDSKFYTTNHELTFCDRKKLGPKEVSRLRWTNQLLEQTAERRGNYSCLGLHEWAMVYKAEEVRHGKTTRLRLPQEQIDQLVESRPITCTHFDAFRFFASEAKPLNKVLPTLDSRIALEQPACIHANMDLYKWAFKAMPWIGSDLLLRCFHLAMDARAIDMRASPYDLSDYPEYPPVKIETPEGRTEYEKLQRMIASRSEPLRQELIEKIQCVLEPVVK